MHHTIEEFQRIHNPEACRFEVFRRLQRELRDEVQPLLDERERLRDENAALKKALADAAESRVQQKDDQREHPDGAKRGTAARAGRGDRPVQGVRQEEREAVTK